MQEKQYEARKEHIARRHQRIKGMVIFALIVMCMMFALAFYT